MRSEISEASRVAARWRRRADTAFSGLRIAWLASCLTALLGLGCATRSLEFRDWFQATTEHYRIVSALGLEETRTLARDLEGFHRALEFVLGAPLPAAPQRTRVYAFDGRSLTRPFSIRGAPGYFLPTLSGGTLVLRRGEGWSGDATLRLRHLYTHFVQRNRDGTDRPLWYDEGIAQFASTLLVTGGSSTSGLLRDDHRAALHDRLGVSIADLLSLRTRRGLSRGDLLRFEADSWAIVHFLVSELGNGDAAWLRRKMRLYEELSARGEPTERAFLRAFGKSVDDVDSELLPYLRGEHFVGVTLRLSETATQPNVQPLGIDDARAALGWLAIDLTRPDTARRFFALALEAKPGHPSATAGLGAADRLDARWDAAESHFASALRAGPNDPAIHLEAGRTLSERAQHESLTSDADARSAHVARARDHYSRSLALDVSQPAAHALLGASYLVAGEDANQGIVSLRRALELLPSSLEAMLLLARLEAKRGGTHEAHWLAEEVLALTHSTQQVREATRLIDDLDSHAVKAERGSLR